MTRKHFEAIAATLNANLAPLPLVQDMADTLAESNERFDRAKFIAASTVKLRDVMQHQSHLIDVAAGRV